MTKSRRTKISEPRQGPETGARRGRMPVWIWAMAAIVAMALAGTVLAVRATEPVAQPPSPSVAGPRVSFEQESLDFGKVPYNRTVDAVYRFRNVGDAPLKVQDLSINVVEGC